MSPRHRFRPLFHVALPVVVATTLVGLAVLNMALVKAGKGEPADGAGLYYSIALVGILAIGVGASVRLRRPRRSRHAALLLADRVVHGRAVVHAQRLVRPSRSVLRMGGRRGAARAAADVPALRVRLSRAARPVGAQARGASAAAPGLPAGLRHRPGPRAGHGADAAGGRRGRVDHATRRRSQPVSRRVPPRGPRRDGARADAAPVGDRAPATPVDRLGIGARRPAVHRALRAALHVRTSGPRRRVHRRAAGLRAAGLRVRHRPLPADGHRGHHQEGPRGRGRRAAAGHDVCRHAGAGQLPARRRLRIAAVSGRSSPRSSSRWWRRGCGDRFRPAWTGCTTAIATTIAARC